MANNIKNTEKNGWGHRADRKVEANSLRRVNDRRCGDCGKSFYPTCDCFPFGADR